MTNASIRNKLALNAIDFCRQTEIAKILPELAQNQWLPAETITKNQIVLLQQILSFASRYVPFYQRLFAKNRWHSSDFSALSDLDQLPVITKEILKSTPLDFMPQERGVQLAYKHRHTGGSTGEPLSYRVANDAFGMRWAATFRVWQMAGYSFGDKMLTLGGASLGNRRRNRLSQYVYNFFRNNYSIPVGQLYEEDLRKIVTRLNIINPSILYGYPSILYIIARFILQHTIAVRSVQRIVTTSELLFDGQRRVIEQAFNAPIFDEYGCPEAGLVSGECNYHQGLHYAMELCLVEVLDSNNTRLPFGQVGRLVATNLVNRAMCLIRYDTGDVGAISDDPCACGRGLIRITNLEGRTRDLIHTPSKGIIHGVAINHLMYNFPWVDRYQIVQDTARELKLNVSVSRSLETAAVEQLRAKLADYAGMDVAVTVNGPYIETKGKKNRLIISNISTHHE